MKNCYDCLHRKAYDDGETDDGTTIWNICCEKTGDWWDEIGWNIPDRSEIAEKCIYYEKKEA